MRHIVVFASLVFVSAPSVLTAQAQDPKAQTAPIFRADSRLVRLSVVVHDDRGRPVPGLTASDFEIMENRREQKISLFLVENSAERVAGGAPATFSNRVDGPASTGVTVILYDRLNTHWEHQQQSRSHIIKYLKQLRPDDRVGFYVLESDAIRVVHGFTRDAVSLLKAIERTTARISPELVASDESLVRPPLTGDPGEDAEIEAWLQDTELMIQGFYRERRIRATLGALEGLAQHLAGVRGRKNVIWISSGFPMRFHDGISLQNVGQDVMRATRALNDADISIYTVDARGLVGAFATPASARQQQFTTLSTVMAPVETSQVIAERTGGRAFFNTNDLGGAIRRAAEDSSLTYVLGYYPDNTEWDGRFRDIKVKVRRKKVDVRHRKGYFAIAPSTPRTTDQTSAIFDALNSPLDESGIGLSARVAPGAEPPEATIVVRVEPDGVTLRKVGDLWEGAVAVAIAQVLPDNSLLKALDTVVPLRFDAKMRERMLAEGIGLTRKIIVRDDAHQIRVCVMDPPTGALGTVTVPASALRQPPDR